ncbi:WD repeat-containing protein 90-like [Rhopilema esculentum]|uniref:WD repeat-containing protein 90-like n=1 Tax=Rhopilema esculentum TaxID=499914 RepID=UPI0031CDB4D6
MSGKLWQQPYVNIFKHFQVSEWKKCSKEGDVSTIMDKTLKGTVYRISGSVPAGNYIQFPKTTSQSLGLTGHYVYFLFKPIVTKYFVVHLDVATEDGIIVRISFSNLFKEFKSTSTWLQFPFISTPPPGSVEEATTHKLPLSSKVGTAPVTSRWTLFCMDLHYVLSVYLNRKYAYLKSLRLCANMMVKNVFTSDTNYQPGISMKVARKTGLLETGFIPLPREMSFPSENFEDWKKRYDYVKFPAEDGSKSFRDVIPGKARSPMQARKSTLGTISPGPIDNISQQISRDAGRRYSAKNYSKQAVKSRVALVDRLVAEKVSMKPVTGTLPELGIKTFEDEIADQNAVHIFAGQNERLHSHEHERNIEKGKSRNRAKEEGTERISDHIGYPSQSSLQSLQPDPILALDKMIGVAGGTMKNVLWTKDSSHVVYPCHAVIVSMDAKSRKQSFFLGHNKEISSLAFNSNCTLLASAQVGEDAVIRIWKFKAKKCLAVFQSHLNDPYCLSLSQSGSKLCVAGSDNHGKQVLSVWDASFISSGHKVTLFAKAHVDIDIRSMKICPFDDSRLVTCGMDNLRVWKVKRGSLRSHPVDTGNRPLPGFTDFDFEVIQNLVQDPSNRKLFACTSSGSLFIINFKNLSILAVHRLSMTNGSSHKEQPRDSTEAALTCISVNEAFCAIGCNDGFVRLWPLEFDQPFMEAEHEGPVSAVGVSPNGILVAAITETGNIGVLDISTRSYKTLIRSHLQKVKSFSFDNIRNHLATVSEDSSIKIWDRPDLNQLYDFRAPGESPCVVSFHPSKELLLCGFVSGCIRVFDVASTNLVAEHRYHKGIIVGMVITPDGNHMLAGDAKGSLALYDASTDEFGLIRLLPNALAKLDEYSEQTMVADNNGRRLACIGPSEFVITVFDARSLDELLRIDITSMANSANRAIVDSANLLCYAPSSINQLLAISSSSRMLKLEANTGQLLSEVSNIHRGRVTGIAISPNGQYLVTAGDKVIKIWDYHMRFDLNFQVFIGHSEPIADLKFTANGSKLYSIGECIFVWDFLGKRSSMTEQRSARKSPKKMLDFSQERTAKANSFVDDVREDHATDTTPFKDSMIRPRKAAPRPTEYDPLDLSISPIPQERPEKKMDESLDISSEESSEKSSVDFAVNRPATPNDKKREQPVVNDLSPLPTATLETVISHHAPPKVMAHFKAREKISKLAEKRYSAPPNQAGLKLNSVVGYDGLGRSNMIWHPVTGLFAYSCGCMVIVEDLTSGKQKHLRYHVEDISTMAVQNDGQVIASASAAGPSSKKSQICVWEVSTGLCRKSINHHKNAVVAMQYSRDDRFLLTIGDYRECSVVIWSTMDYTVLVSTFTRYPIHAVSWDPFTMNEFATVGQNGSVLFWLLDETKQQAFLNIHEAEVPEEIFNDSQETLSYDVIGLCGVNQRVASYLLGTPGITLALCIGKVTTQRYCPSLYILTRLDVTVKESREYFNIRISTVKSRRMEAKSQHEIAFRLLQSINHHKNAVVAMQYSRDDRFLLTIGDYRECSVVIWSTMDYTVLVSTFTRYPIHAVSWDPFTMNEFATVGQNGSVLFWLLDETKQQAFLNIHEAEVPEEIFNDSQESTFDMTSLAYAGASVLYVGASNGVISAWDTRHNSCFMHWKSDNSEILQMIAEKDKLITGGASNNLCLWSVAGVAGLREQEDPNSEILARNTLVMDDEMQLDGCIISAVFDGNLDVGVVGTNGGTLWYISWEERTSIRLVSGHTDQVNGLIFGGHDDDYMVSCASDGSLRLWNTDSYEQTLQFLVLNQHCNAVAFRPVPQPTPLHTLTQDGRHETTIRPKLATKSRPSQCVAGYSDGTVRMFDLGLAEMVLKLQPHPVKVNAISFSQDGRVIISGAEDGSLAVSSPATGMTVRMLKDHRGAPITDIHVSAHKDHSYSLSSPALWLAASADRRVSIWTADWSKDFCELVDWLSFPAPNFAPDGTFVKKTDKDYYSHFPPSLARFSPSDADIVIYTGYGMKKQLAYYSLSQKKVIRAVSLTEWAFTMDISPTENLIAVGSKDRLLKIIDYKEGTFQDFVGHSDSVKVVRFSPTARFLFSVGFTDVFVWEVNA